MHVGVSRSSRPSSRAGPPGASTGLQGPPGASRGLRGQDFEGPQKAYRQSLEPWARLKFHAGWSGWTRPPTMARGGGGVCLQGGVEGVFKGI